MEDNGDNSSNLKWLAFKLLDVVNRVEALSGIGRGHDKRVPTFVHKRVVTELIILSLKIHIHFLRTKVDGRSHRTQFMQTSLVPWLQLWQGVDTLRCKYLFRRTKSGGRWIWEVLIRLLDVGASIIFVRGDIQYVK